MTQILDGKALAKKIVQDCKEKSEKLNPGLGVILVGHDPASQVYVRNKKRMAKKAGIRSISVELPADITQKELLEKVEEMNNNPEVTGFIVQLPLPKHLDEHEVLRAIDPKKDVDGFHACNLGQMFQSKDFELLPPATPAGIIRMLEEYDIDVSGKEVVVVGRSNILGKPISTMLLNRSATVTTCHSRTKNLTEHTKRADLIVVAVGKPFLITGDMIKEGVIVIDAGMNRLEDGQLVGDVDYESVAPKASYITPVPGGVGPMTVASLISNTVRAAQSNI